MPKIYKRNCNWCKKSYIGRGKYYCGYECANKGKGKKISETKKRLFAEGEIIPIWKGKKGWKNPKHSETMKRLFAEGKLKPWNKGLKGFGKKLWQNPEYRERTLRNMAQAIHRRPTNPEKRLIEILNRHFPNEFLYNGDFSHKIMLGGLIPDFISCNGKKLIIEVFGDYWHKIKANIRYVQTEEGRKEFYYKLFGFKTLIFWEHELIPRYGKMLSEEEIVNKIKVFLNE
jgi:very-short-patch-repair endonuclease